MCMLVMPTHKLYTLHVLSLYKDAGYTIYSYKQYTYIELRNLNTILRKHPTNAQHMLTPLHFKYLFCDIQISVCVSPACLASINFI